MPVYFYVCVYVCMYVWMYVCMYVSAMYLSAIQKHNSDKSPWIEKSLDHRWQG